MKKRILICTREIKTGFEQLEENFDVTYDSPTREEFKTMISSYDGVVTLFNNPFLIDDDLIAAAAGRLKIISNYGVGYDKIDTMAASAYGVVVTNTPDPVTEPTAELAMAMMVDVARNISLTDRALRDLSTPYKWSNTSAMGHTLYGKTLGIIGMGRIGKALARRARAFGMVVLYHNRTKLQTMEEWQYDAQYVTKEELLQKSDYVSLNAPATNDTFHIINTKELQLMKPTAVLVNTARGTLVNEQALCDALKNGVIAAAALDVYENGDGNITPELIGMQNVLLTPHIGTQTYETRVEIAKYAAKNIILFFDGKDTLSKVN